MSQRHKLITIISNDKLIEHLIPDMYIYVCIFFCKLYFNYMYLIFIINHTFSIVCLSEGLREN